MDIFSYVNTVALTLIAMVTALTPLMLARMNRRQAETTKDVAEKVETVRTELVEQKAIAVAKMEEIHVAVNGERTAMVAKMDAMHAEILKLTQANVKLVARHPSDPPLLAFPTLPTGRK